MTTKDNEVDLSRLFRLSLKPRLFEVFVLKELLIASRRIAFALTDTLANEAEQQSALLPVATAATIAVSAAVTFGVELNPFGASALAVLQAR